MKVGPYNPEDWGNDPLEPRPSASRRRRRRSNPGNGPREAIEFVLKQFEGLNEALSKRISQLSQ